MKLCSFLLFVMCSVSPALADTFVLDFSTLPSGSVDATGYAINDFIWLKGQNIDVMMSETGKEIISPGGKAVFLFDTSKVELTGIRLNGWANNSPVRAVLYDASIGDAIDVGLGGELVFVSSDSDWGEVIDFAGFSDWPDVARLDVNMAEVYMRSFEVDYTSVPVPAGIWFLGSGIAGFLCLSQRRKDKK